MAWPQIPGLLSGDEPLSREDMMAAATRVPGLLAPQETPAEAEAAIRNRLKFFDFVREWDPEGGFAMRQEPIQGGPAYMGAPAPRQALSPAEQQYWENYSTGLYNTELQRYPDQVDDPGIFARLAREAQRVAPMPSATGPGGVTYPLYQSPHDLYQSLQMSEDNFNTWAGRRALQAVQNPIPGGVPDPIPWRYNRSDPYGR